MWDNSKTPENTLKFYKAMVVSVLLYGSQYWTLTKEQRRKTVVAELSSLDVLQTITGWTTKEIKTLGRSFLHCTLIET